MRLTWAGILFAMTFMSGIGAAAEFQLTSPTIKPKQTIGKAHVFDGFGCAGENVSP
jgi:hypothetical protein